jgi:replication-associated recombination protein RarA
MELLLNPAANKQLERLTAKPPHALIIVAPEGAGKQAVAHQLGAELLGLKEERLDNSGKWLRIAPEGDDPFGIDVVRTAIHFMTMKAAATDAKVQRIAFLPDAQTMTKDAQNALLKLLEEPPEGSMLLLTATSERAMLPTIVSRCQVFQLSPPDSAELTARFKDAGFKDEDIKLAMSISGGLPGLATVLLDPDQQHPLHEAAGTARTLLRQTPFERLTQVDGLAKQRQTCIDVCYILQQMAHVALLNSSGAAANRWQRILTASYDCQQALAARANAKLAMSSLMLAI